MPRYEYECGACGAGVELSRSIADRNNPVVCELCTGDMELVPSLGAFSLKGGGWTPKGFVPTPPKKPRVRKGYDMTGDRDS